MRELAKQFWIPMAILLLSGGAHAERKPVAVGLVGGLNASTLFGADVDNFDLSVWPTGGFTVSFNLPILLALEVNALYQRKSGTIDERSALGEQVVTKLKGDYLELPILARFTAATDFEIDPMVAVGVSFGRLIASEVGADTLRIDPSGFFSPVPADKAIENQDWDKNDFSIVVAGGVEYGLGTFQARTYIRPKTIDTSGQKTIRNAVFALMAGFTF